MRIDDYGEIVNISKNCLGRTHDFKLHKQSGPLPCNVRIYADSGYQGLRKIRKVAATPYKKRRQQPLTERQKLWSHSSQMPNICGTYVCSHQKIQDFIG